MIVYLQERSKAEYMTQIIKIIIKEKYEDLKRIILQGYMNIYNKLIVFI